MNAVKSCEKMGNVNNCVSRYNFLELEELGVGQPRRCETCKDCSR